MTHFQPGDDVEVLFGPNPRYLGRKGWRKAKIISPLVNIAIPPFEMPNQKYEVQFPDGTSGVFDAEHIRAVENPADGAALDEYLRG